MELSFLRLPPSADLACQVENFWFMRGSGPSVMPDGHRILPDGWMEFVFQLGDPFRERGRSGRWRMQPHLLLVGQLERQVDIKPSGLIHTVGIHFKPAGLATFVGGDLSRFANRIWPLAEQLGVDLAPLSSQLNIDLNVRPRINHRGGPGLVVADQVREFGNAIGVNGLKD